MKKESRILTAFTLAEVLLVLAIIGVIAALTIPSLNEETKKHEYVSALRKANSTLSQAIVKVKTENGPMGFGAAWRDGGEFWKAFTRTLNVIKICQSDETGCFTEDTVKKLDGSDGESYNGKGYGVRTADGMSYQYTVGADSAADLGLTAENAAGVMGSFVVDVNGTKGPNKIGEDIYFFALVRGEGIVPAGNGSVADCCYGQAGMTCAAKVLSEGQIKYEKCEGGGASGGSSSGGSSGRAVPTGSTSGGSSSTSGGSAVTSSGGSSSGGSAVTSSGGSSTTSSSGKTSSSSSSSGKTSTSSSGSSSTSSGGGPNKNMNRVTSDDHRGSNLAR